MERLHCIFLHGGDAVPPTTVVHLLGRRRWGASTASSLHGGDAVPPTTVVHWLGRRRCGVPTASSCTAGTPCLLQQLFTGWVEADGVFPLHLLARRGRRASYLSAAKITNSFRFNKFLAVCLLPGLLFSLLFPPRQPLRLVFFCLSSSCNTLFSTIRFSQQELK